MCTGVSGQNSAESYTRSASISLVLQVAMEIHHRVVSSHRLTRKTIISWAIAFQDLLFYIPRYPASNMCRVVDGVMDSEIETTENE